MRWEKEVNVEKLKSFCSEKVEYEKNNFRRKGQILLNEEEWKI